MTNWSRSVRQAVSLEFIAPNWEVVLTGGGGAMARLDDSARPKPSFAQRRRPVAVAMVESPPAPRSRGSGTAAALSLPRWLPISESNCHLKMSNDVDRHPGRLSGGVVASSAADFAGKQGHDLSTQVAADAAASPNKRLRPVARNPTSVARSSVGAVAGRAAAVMGGAGGRRWAVRRGCTSWPKS